MRTILSRHPWRMRCLATGAAALLVLASPAARAEQDDTRLLDLSIAELMGLKVTSASKTTQNVAESAAAVFVITQDDIQRSGARNIPEALRMAPGLEVAQIDANRWAVSARGFNGRFANKLLVLMDGRALYTPTFGAVFWDVQDTLMENIERIEVIRGPGGAVWGVNAVNGVINIITRSSTDSQGTEAIVGLDSGPRKLASISHGGHAGDSGTYRLYAKYDEQAGSEDIDGNRTDDDTHLARGGLRMDWEPRGGQRLSLTGEGYAGQSGQTVIRRTITPPYATPTEAADRVSGAFVIGALEQQLASGRELQAHFYFDGTNRAGALFGEDHRSGSVDAQYRFLAGSRQDVVVGGGFRYTQFHVTGSTDLKILLPDPSNSDYNLFVEDRVALVPDRLSLTLGLNAEHNPLSTRSVDPLPSGRLMWTLSERSHAWASVTSAIGTPSYEQTGAIVRNSAPVLPPGTGENPFPVPMVFVVAANPLFRSEQLVAYEVGFRTQPVAAVSIDVAAFLNKYRDLWGVTTRNVSCEPSGTSVFVDPMCFLGATNVVTELQSTNGVQGHTSGVEVSAEWSPTTRYRLRGTYTYLRMALEANRPDPQLSAFADGSAGQNPTHQLLLRADLSIAPGLDLDAAARYVSRLESAGIPQYWSGDLNLMWRPTPRLECALTGRNLLQPSHQEFTSEFRDIPSTLVARTIGLRLRWQL